jgi:hypothetical protein
MTAYKCRDPLELPQSHFESLGRLYEWVLDTCIEAVQTDTYTRVEQRQRYLTLAFAGNKMLADYIMQHALVDARELQEPIHD